jgi:hypothetical protein
MREKDRRDKVRQSIIEEGR